MKFPVSVIILVSFLISSVIGPLPIAQAYEFHLPAPGVRVGLSPGFSPAILKGITIHPENPFQFDFIVNQGDSRIPSDQKKEAYQRLVKYFLASLTTPEKDLWVNLSPYEKDRIIPEVFGKTEMGRDLLAQDYLLKQITASLIYPDEKFGKEFWKKVYSKAAKEFGTTDVSVNTFNKVWIIPDQATVYENGNTAYVLKSHLKVMLEEDYLSMSKHQMPTARVNNGSTSESVHAMGSQAVREIVLPQLEKEVNEGNNFALLRQVNNSLILATWFKKRLKESVLGRIYADKGKVKGVDQDPRNNEVIYRQYLRAYKKGVFNYIKEDFDTLSQQMIPRKYFSGGWTTRAPNSKGDGTTDLAQRVEVKDKSTITAEDVAILEGEADKNDEDVTINLVSPAVYNANPNTAQSLVKEFTDPDVLAEPKADPVKVSDVTHPFLSYEGKVRFATVRVKVKLPDGTEQETQELRPVNPRETTGYTGRGKLWYWGANFAGDMIITRTNPDTGALEVFQILRDTGEWAMPGGMKELGENALRTALRELAEEAGIDVPASAIHRVKEIYKGYVRDPRNTNNAWIESTAFHVHLSEEQVANLKPVHLQESEVKDFRWAPVDEQTINESYGSHGDFLKIVLQNFSSPNIKIGIKLSDTTNSLIEEPLKKRAQKQWERFALRELIKSIKKYKKSERWKKEINSAYRGVFKKTDGLETWAQAIQKNGFLKEPGFLDEWVEKCFDDISKGTGTGTDKRDALKLASIQDPDLREQIVKFMKEKINKLLEDFVQGKIELSELGLSKIKKASLRMNALFTASLMTEFASSVALAVVMPRLAGLGLDELMLHFDAPIKLSLNFWEFVASSILTIIIFNKMEDKTREIFTHSLENYNENALSNEIEGRTPEMLQKDSEEFEAFFDNLENSYQDQISIERAAVHELRRYVRVGLEGDARFRRAGYNVAHAEAINGQRDLINKERGIMEKPLISRNSIIMYMLKELRDQNPKYLKELQIKWEKEKKHKKNTGSAQPITADIFLKALEQIENENDIFDRELELQVDEELKGASVLKMERAKIKAKLKATDKIDAPFLDSLFTWIGKNIEGNTESGLEKRKDIITARFYLGALSRLWQIIDGNDNANPGYTKRLLANTNKIIEILGRMIGQRTRNGSPKYGLTDDQIRYMISTLQTALSTLDAISLFKKNFPGISSEAIDLIIGKKPIAFYSTTHTELVARGIRDLLGVYRLYKGRHPKMADALRRFASGEQLNAEGRDLLSRTRLFEEKKEGQKSIVVVPPALQYVVLNYDRLVNLHHDGEDLGSAQRLAGEYGEFLQQDVGGIDLNPANQNLAVQGKGNDFVFTQDQFKNLDPAQITGFSPIVVAIKPIHDLYKILGINGI